MRFELYNDTQTFNVIILVHDNKTFIIIRILVLMYLTPIKIANLLLKLNEIGFKSGMEIMFFRYPVLT